MDEYVALTTVAFKRGFSSGLTSPNYSFALSSPKGKEAVKALFVRYEQKPILVDKVSKEKKQAHAVQLMNLKGMFSRSVTNVGQDTKNYRA